MRGSLPYKDSQWWILIEALSMEGSDVPIANYKYPEGPIPW